VASYNVVVVVSKPSQRATFVWGVQVIRDELRRDVVRVVAGKYTKINDAYRCGSSVENEETGPTVYGRSGEEKLDMEQSRRKRKEIHCGIAVM
jgi:hypothetical protein